MSALAERLRLPEWDDAYPTTEARLAARRHLQANTPGNLATFLDIGWPPDPPRLTAADVPELIDALESPHWTVVWSALYFLGQLHDPRALSPLLAQVSDPTREPDRARVALWSLRGLLRPEHQEPLEAALSAWQTANPKHSGLVRVGLLRVLYQHATDDPVAHARRVLDDALRVAGDALRMDHEEADRLGSRSPGYPLELSLSAQLLQEIVRLLASVRAKEAIPLLQAIVAGAECNGPSVPSHDRVVAAMFLGLVRDEARAALREIVPHHFPLTPERGRELVALICASAQGAEGGVAATLEAAGLARVALGQFAHATPQEVIETLGELVWQLARAARRGARPSASLVQEIGTSLRQGTLAPLRQYASTGSLRHQLSGDLPVQQRLETQRSECRLAVGPYQSDPALIPPLLAALEQASDPDVLRVLLVYLEVVREPHHRAELQRIFERLEEPMVPFPSTDPFVAADYLAWRRADELQETRSSFWERWLKRWAV